MDGMPDGMELALDRFGDLDGAMIRFQYLDYTAHSMRVQIKGGTLDGFNEEL